jgi:AraC family transcriptional regulator
MILILEVKQMDWIQGMSNAIDFMEAHLLEPIDFDEIARQACSSTFHFMRMFNILTGLIVSEYIRNRRPTLAGNELSLSDAKVIDVAFKYGYETHESFTKAFRQFHGITPSARANRGRHSNPLANFKYR